MKKAFLILLSFLCIMGINNVKANEVDTFEETSSIEIIDNTTYNIIDRIYKKGTSEEYRILKVISDKDSSYYDSRNDFITQNGKKIKVRFFEDYLRATKPSSITHGLEIKPGWVSAGSRWTTVETEEYISELSNSALLAILLKALDVSEVPNSIINAILIVFKTDPYRKYDTDMKVRTYQYCYTNILNCRGYIKQVYTNDYEYIDDAAWKTSNFGTDGVTPF